MQPPFLPAWVLYTYMGLKTQSLFLFKWPDASLRAEVAAAMSRLRPCLIRAVGGRLCGGVKAAISPRSDPLRVVLRFFLFGVGLAPRHLGLLLIWNHEAHPNRRAIEARLARGAS